MIRFVTDFADAGLVVPIAGTILVLLLLLRETRSALLWSLAVGPVLAGSLALKLSLAGCAPPSPFAVLRSPSGHTAAAVVVYGGLAAILGGGVMLTVAQSLGVAGLIGTSRVLLAAHTPYEAVVGGGVGLVGAMCLALAWRPIPRSERRRALAILVPVVVCALVGALHGTHWSAESLIHHPVWRFWPLNACGG